MPQPTTKRARNFNRQGYSVEMSGYVTTLLSVTNRSSAELERTLKFGAGRLQSGWALYFLVQGVSIHEFVHQGTTRYSGGLAYDRDATEQLRAAGAPVRSASSSVFQWRRGPNSRTHGGTAYRSGNSRY